MHQEDDFDHETRETIHRNSCKLCGGDPTLGLYPLYCSDCFLKEAKELLRSGDSDELYKKAHWMIDQLLKLVDPKKIPKPSEQDIPKAVRGLGFHFWWEYAWHVENARKDDDDYKPISNKEVCKRLLEFHHEYREAK